MRAQKISAAKAARSLSEILNRVKYRGESFIVERQPSAGSSPWVVESQSPHASLLSSGLAYRVRTTSLPTTLRKFTTCFVTYRVRLEGVKNRGSAACCAQRLSLSGPASQKEKTIKLSRLSPLNGKPEAFRTVLVGLWADPVVTRKFHVASRRINNLRELSGEQAASRASSSPGIIAATAVAYKSSLATLNVREFQKIEGLEMLALSPRRLRRSREG